jgi:hypothetical protein
MLAIYTLVFIAAVTYAFWQEGLLTNACACVNVFLSGVVAFNLYELLADQLDPMFHGNFLAGTEDFLSMVLIFSVTLGVLRLTTGSLAPTDPEYHPILFRGGSVLLGILTGYLAGGFMVCAITTLPVPRGFLGYEEKPQADLPTANKILPGDRVWLAMMHRAGNTNLSWGEDPTFDPKGNWHLRHSRHRRVDEASGKSTPEDGTFLPADVGKK